MGLVICHGCGADGATESLWLEAPLGLCSVKVHRVRECAEAARRARGGGRFVTLGPSKEEKAAAKLRGK